MSDEVVLSEAQEQLFWQYVTLWERARGENALRAGLMSLGLGIGYPWFRDDEHLDFFRAEARMLARQNTFCKGALKSFVSTVMGGGGKWTVTSEDSTIKKTIEDFLAEFNTVVSWFPITITRPLKGAVRPPRASEMVRRLVVEGEVFLRLFASDTVGCIVRFVAPEHVRSPQSNDDGYFCGVLCDEDDSESVSGFWIVKNHTDGSHVSVDDIIHVLNPDTDSNVHRGLSDLLFEVGDNLRQASEIQRAVNIGARERAKVVTVWQYLYATADQVTSIAQQYKSFQLSHFSTGQLDTYTYGEPGQTLRVGPGQQAVPMTIDYSEQYLIAQTGALRAAGSGLVMPEYVISQNASNNNFASIKEAGMPFIRNVEDFQAIVRTVSIRLGYEAISRAGLPLEGYILGCELPAPTQRDSLQITQEDSALVDRKIKSRQTCALERGLNWEEEKKRIAAEAYIQDQTPKGSGNQGASNGRDTVSRNGSLNGTPAEG